VDPLKDAFRAANGDNDITRALRLEDEADGNLVVITIRIHIRCEVVRINRCDDVIADDGAAVVALFHLTGGVGEVVNRYCISCIHKLRILNGDVDVHSGGYSRPQVSSKQSQFRSKDFERM